MEIDLNKIIIFSKSKILDFEFQKLYHNKKYTKIHHKLDSIELESLKKLETKTQIRELKSELKKYSSSLKKESCLFNIKLVNNKSFLTISLKIVEENNLDVDLFTVFKNESPVLRFLFESIYEVFNNS